jgi:hypothetical protein
MIFLIPGISAACNKTLRRSGAGKANYTEMVFIA